MRMALGLSLTLATGACVASDQGRAPAREELRVTGKGQPYQMWDGAAARRAADAECGPGGVRSSIYDRYDRATGAWVYPGGCA
jgi:hypothetical protein